MACDSVNVTRCSAGDASWAMASTMTDWLIGSPIPFGVHVTVQTSPQLDAEDLLGLQHRHASEIDADLVHAISGSGVAADNKPGKSLG